MKIVKVISGFILSVLVSVIYGCSNNIITPDNSTFSEMLNSKKNQPTIETIAPGYIQFKSSFLIQPHSMIILNSNVTSLSGIKKFSISNCNPEKKELLISSSYIDQFGSLGCQWSSNSDFLLIDLTIENAGDQIKNIDVILTGIPVK